MSFAINVIGHYVLPNCAGRRRRGVGDISVSATCSPGRNLVIVVDLADVTISGVDKVRIVEGLKYFGKLDRGSILSRVLAKIKKRDGVNVTDW